MNILLNGVSNGPVYRTLSEIEKTSRSFASKGVTFVVFAVSQACKGMLSSDTTINAEKSFSKKPMSQSFKTSKKIIHKKMVLWKENLQQPATRASPRASKKPRKSILKKNIATTEYILPAWAIPQEKSILKALTQHKKLPSFKDVKQLKVLVYEFTYEILRIQENDDIPCAAIKRLPLRKRVKMLNIFKEKDFCNTLHRLVTMREDEYVRVHDLLHKNAQKRK